MNEWNGTLGLSVLELELMLVPLLCADPESARSCDRDLLPLIPACDTHQYAIVTKYGGLKLFGNTATSYPHHIK